jgi:hypothetical protein
MESTSNLRLTLFNHKEKLKLICNEMEGGFMESTSNLRLTLFNRKEKLKLISFLVFNQSI